MLLWSTSTKKMQTMQLGKWMDKFCQVDVFGVHMPDRGCEELDDAVGLMPVSGVTSVVKEVTSLGIVTKSGDNGVGIEKDGAVPEEVIQGHALEVVDQGHAQGAEGQEQSQGLEVGIGRGRPERKAGAEAVQEVARGLERPDHPRNPQDENEKNVKKNQNQKLQNRTELNHLRKLKAFRLMK